jgi:hypothetical protein
MSVWIRAEQLKAPAVYCHGRRTTLPVRPVISSATIKNWESGRHHAMRAQLSPLSRVVALEAQGIVFVDDGGVRWLSPHRSQRRAQRN